MFLLRMCLLLSMNPVGISYDPGPGCCLKADYDLFPVPIFQTGLETYFFVYIILFTFDVILYELGAGIFKIYF